MKRKIAIVGATGGLGREICFKFADMNADMIFLGRNKNKTMAFADEIIEKYPNIQIDFVEIDLVNIDSVKSACDKLEEMDFDTIVLNAGIYSVPRFITSTGYENIFQVNFVSQYYIAYRMLEKFRKQKGGKVVAVGSVAYNYSKIDCEDVDFKTRKKASQVYGNSKRFLMFALYKLFENEKDVDLSIVHPGVTLTQMTNHYPKGINWLVKLGIKIIFPSPQNASRSIVYGINESCGYFEWIGPRVFKVWGKPKKQKIKMCEDEANRAFIVASTIMKKI